jgi:hypothetical protein
VGDMVLGSGDCSADASPASNTESNAGDGWTDFRVCLLPGQRLWLAEHIVTDGSIPFRTLEARQEGQLPDSGLVSQMENMTREFTVPRALPRTL